MGYYHCNSPYVCGVDLHSKMMYICIMDSNCNILVHKKIYNHEIKLFKKELSPYLGKIVVSAESSFAYYFLSDLCSELNVPFYLGHALYMAHIHGTKTKNDRIDSKKIAELTTKNYLPMAHVASKEVRYIRDLMRTRNKHMQSKSKLITQIKTRLYQTNLPTFDKITEKLIKERVLTKDIKDLNLKFTIEKDLELIQFYRKSISEMDTQIQKELVKIKDKSYELLSSIKGFGFVITATILLEIDDITRFKNHKHFISYCRLVKCAHESAGKKHGHGNVKSGNPHLRYIFGEAAVHMIKNEKRVKEFADKLKSKYGNSKGLSILAHRIARVVYYILRDEKPFDLDRFLQTD